MSLTLASARAPWNLSQASSGGRSCSWPSIADCLHIQLGMIDSALAVHRGYRVQAVLASFSPLSSKPHSVLLLVGRPFNFLSPASPCSHLERSNKADKFAGLQLHAHQLDLMAFSSVWQL